MHIRFQWNSVGSPKPPAPKNVLTEVIEMERPDAKRVEVSRV